jgi:hypothetical protein
MFCPRDLPTGVNHGLDGEPWRGRPTRLFGIWSLKVTFQALELSFHHLKAHYSNTSSRSLSMGTTRRPAATRATPAASGTWPTLSGKTTTVQGAYVRRQRQELEHPGHPWGCQHSHLALHLQVVVRGESGTDRSGGCSSYYRKRPRRHNYGLDSLWRGVD